MTERIVPQDNENDLTKQERPSQELRIHQTVYVDEGQLILLQQRTRKQRKSMSKTIEGLISPAINTIKDTLPEEQTQLLSQIRERIIQKYEDYDAVYIRKEKEGGPHPFMGINCLFSEQLVYTAARYASQIGMETKDFLSDLLAGSLPQLTESGS